MLYRKLGHTGLDVSVLSFGTWQLGGQRWRALPDSASLDLLTRARDMGVNLFDVSAVYGQYTDEQGYRQSRAQELVGKAFEGRRDQVIYNLKIGHLDEVTHRINFSPTWLIDQFHHSLRRLRTDRADICLLHAPTLAQIRTGRAIAVLETLRALGLVGAIGYSLEDEPDHLTAAIEQDIDVVEVQYNLLAPHCAEAIEQAGAHGVGILVNGPFKRGYLSGKFRSTADLPVDDDYWRYALRYYDKKVEEWLAQVGRYLDQYGSPAAVREAALRFVLSHSGVSSAVVGFRALEELDENLAHVMAIAGKQAPATALDTRARLIRTTNNTAPVAVAT